MLSLEHYGVTDPGKVRKNNEDSLLVGEGRDASLFAVADGIGGFEAGEVASSIAVSVLKNVAPSTPLEEAIREANWRILAASREDESLSNMGTTVVALRFGGTEQEPVAEVSHVGDSRAYLLRDGDLKPVTEDHSLVAELVRSGDLTRAQANEHPQKNLITRALGAEEEVEVDTAVLPVRAGDRLILCSDGLSDMVPETRMRGLLISLEEPEEAARALISAALDAGGTDNATIVIVDVREEGSPDQEPRQSGTQEMRVLTSESPGLLEETGTPRRRERKPSSPRSGRARSKRAPRAKKGRGSWQNLATFVRALTVVLVLAAFASPVYLWGSSRYFLGLDNSEVVVYRGLPYAPLGYQLNKEVQRTGLTEDEIEPRYRDQVDNHKLYPSEGQAADAATSWKAGER